MEDVTQDSHGSRLREDVSVNVHHEVSARRVLHDKTHVLRRLEAREQVDQEGVVGAVDRLKDPLLTHQTADSRGRGSVTRDGASSRTVKDVSGYLSTSSRATMSPFFRALMANRPPVFLYSDSKT